MRSYVQLRALERCVHEPRPAHSPVQAMAESLNKLTCLTTIKLYLTCLYCDVTFRCYFLQIPRHMKSFLKVIKDIYHYGFYDTFGKAFWSTLFSTFMDYQSHNNIWLVIFPLVHFSEYQHLKPTPWVDKAFCTSTKSRIGYQVQGITQDVVRAKLPLHLCFAYKLCQCMYKDTDFLIVLPC